MNVLDRIGKKTFIDLDGHQMSYQWGRWWSFPIGQTSADKLETDVAPWGPFNTALLTFPCLFGKLFSGFSCWNVRHQWIILEDRHFNFLYSHLMNLFYFISRAKELQLVRINRMHSVRDQGRHEQSWEGYLINHTTDHSHWGSGPVFDQAYGIPHFFTFLIVWAATSCSYMLGSRRRGPNHS